MAAIRLRGMTWDHRRAIDPLLAMVRREIAPGTPLRATWEGGEFLATVVMLPFSHG